MSNLVLGFTGHRPERIIDYNETRLLSLCNAIIDKYQPDLIITGMALGWDSCIAQSAIEKEIEFDAAIPFLGQELKWLGSDRKKYHRILKSARNIQIISEGGFTPTKMQKRNQYIVDNCDILIALWDGKEYGGTWNCIRYGKEKGKKIVNVYQSWIKFK
jgi:uncharacterized phage-like protein YoqJ